MSSGDTGLTVRLVRRDVDGCVLAVSGELSLRSAGVLSERLWKVLAESGRVLVDVSGLRLTGVPAVQVFSWTLAGLGDWPQTRLVLFGATPELTRELTAMRVTQRVPVAPDETAARLRLDRRPPVVVRTLDLAQELASARRARLVRAGHLYRLEAAHDPHRCDGRGLGTGGQRRAARPHRGPPCLQRPERRGRAVDLDAPGRPVGAPHQP